VLHPESTSSHVPPIPHQYRTLSIQGRRTYLGTPRNDIQPSRLDLRERVGRAIHAEVGVGDEVERVVGRILGLCDISICQTKEAANGHRLEGRDAVTGD